MPTTSSRGRSAAVAARRGIAGCAIITAIAAVIAGCGIRTAATGFGHPGTAAGGNGAAGGRAASPATVIRSARPGTTPASPGHRGVGACGPSGIQVRLDLSSAGVAAGTSYLPLDFTNVSALPCDLAGFPVITLAGRPGRPVGTAGQADRSLAPEVLLLGTGQSAHVWLRLADITNVPAIECQPVAAAGLRVWLPGAASATFIGHRLAACGKLVASIGILMVEPFRPGRARRGSAG